MALDFIGVGDLHLDGKLQKYLPNLNSIIIGEVEKTMEYARRMGVRLLVFYGDICDKPDMSKEAQRVLLSLVASNPEFQFIFLLGNHDTENAELHSMQLFADMVNFKLIPNLRVIEKPTTLFRSSGTPLRLLPWPSLDTRADCLNVIHEEVANAVWDHGRAVNSTHSVPEDHICVGGHLHTPQRAGSVDYSGTLYQTSFGEKPKKYFHHVTWSDAAEKPKIKRIRNIPTIRLENLVVNSQADLGSIENDPNVLYKVFVHSDVLLDAGTLAAYPNVVKTNSFKTKVELTSLIEEEIRLDSGVELSGVLSVSNNLQDWLLSADVSDDLRRKAFRKFKALTASQPKEQR